VGFKGDVVMWKSLCVGVVWNSGGETLPGGIWEEGEKNRATSVCMTLMGGKRKRGLKGEHLKKTRWGGGRYYKSARPWARKDPSRRGAGKEAGKS